MNFKFLICKETWMISSEDLPFTEHIYNIHSDTSKEKKGIMAGEKGNF